MPKTKEQKQEVVKNIKDKIERSKSIVFTKFDKLGVKENEELRKALKTENNEYYVAKKTLFNLAFKDIKIDGFEPKNFAGRLAAVFGYGDEVAPAKIVDKFKTDNENKVEFLGGILENRFISAEEVGALAKIPGRQELYASMVGSLNAPISGFVNVLAGNIRSLVTVLLAVKDKKEEN